LSNPKSGKKKPKNIFLIWDCGSKEGHR
jgi:hypothetical protein